MLRRVYRCKAFSVWPHKWMRCEILDEFVEEGMVFENAALYHYSPRVYLAIDEDGDFRFVLKRTYHNSYEFCYHDPFVRGVMLK